MAHVDSDSRAAVVAKRNAIFATYPGVLVRFFAVQGGGAGRGWLVQISDRRQQSEAPVTFQQLYFNLGPGPTVAGRGPRGWYALTVEEANLAFPT